MSWDHFQFSPKWKQEGEELQLAKECEKAIREGLERGARVRVGQEQRQRHHADIESKPALI